MTDSHLLTSGDRVRLHDAVNGTLEWDSDLIKPSCPPIVVETGGGVDVFVGSFDGWIYRLSYASGNQEAKLPLSTPPVQHVVRGLAHADGVIFATAGTLSGSTNAGGLYAYELGSGPLWKHDMGEIAWGSPVVFDGTVYAGSWDGKLYAIGVDGTPAWIATSHDFWAAQPIVSDGVVYADAWDTIVALDAKTGSVLWEAQASNEANITSPLAVGDGRVYAATAWGAGLCAFDAASGTELWSVSAGGHATPPLYWMGRVFAATEHGAGAGYLRAFDADDGDLVWQSQVPVGSSGDAVSRPTMDEGPVTNHVFVTSQDGNAYGFDSANGALAWQVAIGGGWPVDPTWTDAPVVSFARKPLYYAAVDPLSLVLKSDIYVKINLPYPPPVESMRARVRKAAGGMNDREKRNVLEQMQRLGGVAEALAGAIEEPRG